MHQIQFRPQLAPNFNAEAPVLLQTA